MKSCCWQHCCIYTHRDVGSAVLLSVHQKYRLLPPYITAVSSTRNSGRRNTRRNNISCVVLCLQKSLLPTPKCGLPFMSILLHTCAGLDIDQLILLRMLSSTMYSRNWDILFMVSLVFAHSKTGKLSLRLLDRAVSTEILVQNLTTPGTKSHMHDLCKHEGAHQD